MFLTRGFNVEVAFRALADRTRLRILHLLQGGELCVCHIVSVLGAPQPKVSPHPAYLRRAGFVVTRRDGPWHYYRLARPISVSHKNVLQCVAACGLELTELAGDLERLRTTETSRCCD